MQAMEIFPFGQHRQGPRRSRSATSWSLRATVIAAAHLTRTRSASSTHKSRRPAGTYVTGKEGRHGAQGGTSTRSPTTRSASRVRHPGRSSPDRVPRRHHHRALAKGAWAASRRPQVGVHNPRPSKMPTHMSVSWRPTSSPRGLLENGLRVQALHGPQALTALAK